MSETMEAVDAVTELRIPAEHVSWFRRDIKSELSVNAHDFPGTQDLTRAFATKAHEMIGRYTELLNELGWSDDGEEKTVQLEVDLARDLLSCGLGQLGEDMQVASGGYESEPLCLSEVKQVASRAMWLAETFAALPATDDEEES